MALTSNARAHRRSDNLQVCPVSLHAAPSIEKATVHARVGDQERDLHAGGRCSYHGIRGQPENTGSEPVPAGEKPTTISRAEENACDLIGHVVYRDRGEKDPDK